MEDKNLKGHAALLAAYLIFGLNTPISKVVLMQGGTSALALTFYRFAGATALFWIASLFIAKERVKLRDLRQLFLASIIGIFVNQLPFIIGLSLTSPINASVITTSSPILTMLLAAFFLKEPITWKKVVGVLTGAAGALLLIFGGTPVDHDKSAGITGDLLCVLSCASFSVYLAAFKQLITRYSPVSSMKWMFLFATLCSLPFCWRDVIAVDYGAMPSDVYLQIAYVVGMATFVSYLLVPVGQKRLRPTIVSMYNYLQPLVSSLIALALGMDAFGWTKGMASLLVFLGVYIVIQSKSRAQMESEKRQSTSSLNCSVENSVKDRKRFVLF